MSAKKTISLKRVKNGKSEDFVFDHALALLRLQASKGSNGWELNEKDWKFQNNEIIRRSNTGTSKEAKEQ